MTEQEAIELLQNLNVKLTDMSGHKTNGIEQIFGWNEISAICEAIKAMEEIQQYRAIGTPEECLAAVEKQKEMIAYCDENDCSDCIFHNTNQKDNKCMNDFIADEIVKGGGVNE